MWSMSIFTGKWPEHEVAYEIDIDGERVRWDDVINSCVFLLNVQAPQIALEALSEGFRLRVSINIKYAWKYRLLVIWDMQGQVL